MMGAKSRSKGARIELSILHMLQDAGLDCEKLSRMYAKTHDMRLKLLGRDRKLEVKCRADGFATIYNWIDPVDILVLRRDRSEPLFVMRLSELLELIKNAPRSST